MIADDDYDVELGRVGNGVNGRAIVEQQNGNVDEPRVGNKAASFLPSLDATTATATPIPGGPETAVAGAVEKNNFPSTLSGVAPLKKALSDPNVIPMRKYSAGSIGGREITIGPRKQLSISWCNLSVTVARRQTIQEKCIQPMRFKSSPDEPVSILSNCSGLVKSGQVLAIMGASGSGKTTLLDCLANRLRSGKVVGNVFYGGKKRSEKHRRALMAYVAQEDALLGSFTVRETLTMAGRFYFGYAGFSTLADLQERVQEIIDQMGLLSCAETTVGSVFFKGISGGQARRLSIGIELISNPPILLLDECTSGLDSSSAYAIIKNLKNLAFNGWVLYFSLSLSLHSPQ